MQIFKSLFEANQARNAIWDEDNKLDLNFFMIALAGEVGEACNVYKKMARERLGLRGSIAHSIDLLDELADTVIYAYLAAQALNGTNLSLYIPHKFNGTSIKYELPVMMEIPGLYEDDSPASGELPENDDAADVMNKLAELYLQVKDADDDYLVSFSVGELRALLGEK